MIFFEIRKNSIEKVYLFFLFLFSTGFLMLTDDKRAGLPFVRELIILIIFLHFIVRIVFNRWYFKTDEENFILIYVFSFVVLSSLNSFFFHDQPFIYSVFEERRLFQFLLFFIAFWALLKKTVTIDQIIFFLIASFLITSFWGYLYYFHIIPDNAQPDFAVDFRDVLNSLDIRTETRYIVGTTWLSVIFTFSVLRIREIYITKGSLSFWYILLVFYIFFFVWLVIQTRSVMLTLALVLMVVLRRYLLVFFLKYGFIFLSLIIAVAFIFQDMVFTQIDKFNILLEEATASTETRVREVTVNIILNEIQNSYYFGQGALSLQWKGGFLELYNPNFYLSDVGIFGVYYRFGFLSVLFIVGFYVFLFLNLYNFRNHHLVIKSYLYLFIIGLPGLVMNPQMANGGFAVGLVLAIIAYFKVNLKMRKGE